MRSVVVRRLRQPLHLSHVQQSCQRQTLSLLEYRITNSYRATFLPTLGSVKMSTTTTSAVASDTDRLPPTNPPPLLALPPGMPFVAERDDSSLLKALMDYQEEQRRKLEERLQSSKRRRHFIQDMVGRTVRAAECALLVLDRMARPTAEQYLMVLDAWNHASTATSSTMLQSQFKGIPQRAELVLQRMVQQQLLITTQEYNVVLKLWANSKEYLRGYYCERFFQQSFEAAYQEQQRQKRQQFPLPRPAQQPDAESYRWIIRAWYNSTEDQRPFCSTRHLMKWRNSDIEHPLLEDYHMVLEQWSRSRFYKRSVHAWKILLSMLDWDTDKTKLVRPDRTCYRHCLQTLSTTYLPELGEHADKILQHMMERQVLPDTDCYAYAICTWKNTAMVEKKRDLLYEAAARAHALLNDMSTAYHRSTVVVVKPTTDICNDVLRAWHAASSRHAQAVDKAEEILTMMETATEANLRPDVHSYRLVLDTMAMQIQPSEKLRRADHILKRMKKHIGVVKAADDADVLATEIEMGPATVPTEVANEDDFENVDLDKTAIAVFNAYLRVCASIKILDESDRVYVLRRAFEVLDEMETDPNLEVQSGTYLAFLDVVANITGNRTKECAYAAERVFHKCCRQGLLNKFVLKAFQALVSEEVFVRVVQDRSTRDDADHKWLVPQEWTRRSRLPTIQTEQGRRQLPLSVEGKYVVPPEALDYRARNLRERKGQRLLQGGRIYKNNS